MNLDFDRCTMLSLKCGSCLGERMRANPNQLLNFFYQFEVNFFRSYLWTATNSKEGTVARSGFSLVWGRRNQLLEGYNVPGKVLGFRLEFSFFDRTKPP